MGVTVTMEDWISELRRLLKEVREAKLVGCVRGYMLLGAINCPLFEYCLEAPKKDIQDRLADINRPSLLADIEPEKALEIVNEGFELLEEAKRISRRCPLRNLTERIFITPSAPEGFELFPPLTLGELPCPYVERCTSEKRGRQCMNDSHKTCEIFINKKEDVS